MTDPYTLWRGRLRNWGRSARLSPDCPDSSCANPMYEWMIEREEGWGSDEDAKKAERTQEAGAEWPPIDEYDAEILDTWIHQLPGVHKQVTIRKWKWQLPEPRECVDAAIRAIWDLQERNWASNQEMRKRLNPR